MTLHLNISLLPMIATDVLLTPTANLTLRGGECLIIAADLLFKRVIMTKAMTIVLFLDSLVLTVVHVVLSLIYVVPSSICSDT